MLAHMTLAQMSMTSSRSHNQIPSCQPAFPHYMRQRPLVEAIVRDTSILVGVCVCAEERMRVHEYYFKFQKL
jgi:hypothetical protein